VRATARGASCEGVAVAWLAPRLPRLLPLPAVPVRLPRFPPPQAAAAALKSAELYCTFLQAFKPPGAAGRAGAAAHLPEHIDGGDEAHAVRAAFHAGCMMNAAARLGACGGASGGGGGGGPAAGAGVKAGAPEAPPPGTAQALLRWMAAYVQRHGLAEFDQEAELAAELAGLLDQREELLGSCLAAAGGAAGGRAAGKAARRAT
jgi:hypothetical protein